MFRILIMMKSKIKSKSKSKSKKHNTKTIKPSNNVSNRLANLLNTISNNRSGLGKSEINLPARLMQNTNLRQTINPQPLEYSKSVSSTFTSSMHNGVVHSAGKEVINDSTKPFIQVAELHNGQVEHYMMPRNQFNLTSPSKTKKTKKTKKTRK